MANRPNPFHDIEQQEVQKRILSYQQHVGYNCVLYREGLQHLKDHPEQQKKRREWIPPIPGPRWKTHFKNPLFGRNQMYDMTPFSRVAPQGQPEKVGDKFLGYKKSPEVQNAIARANDLVGAMSDFRITKVMGWGGMGAVLLAELSEAKKGQLQKVVIKMNLSKKSEGNFVKERQNHIRVARAAHIIQCLVVEDGQQQQQQDKNNIAPPQPAASGMKRKYVADAADEAYHASKKKRVTDEQAPGGGRPIVAAPFQAVKPRGPMNRHIFARAKDFLAPKEETKRRSDAKYDLNTHPDMIVIEPMMRGEFDMWVRKMAHSGDRFHNKVLWLIFECLFKAVLGFAHPPRHYHEYRETGGRTGPFMEERLPDRRDVVKFDKDEFLHFDLDLVNTSFTPEIAGQYSWKTNLYWIGQVMWCLVTLHKPSRMPFPYWIRDVRPPEDRRGRAQATEKGLYGELGFWSWGGLVNHSRYSQIDEDLRSAIVLCMADKPAHRPEAKQLWDWIEKKTTQEWDGLSKEEAHHWATKFWEQPDVPGPAKPTPIFEVPGEEPDKEERAPRKNSARLPWEAGKIPELAGVSPLKQHQLGGVGSYDFAFRIPGQWPKLSKMLSAQQAQEQLKPAFKDRVPKALNLQPPTPKPQNPAAPQQAVDTPGEGPFGRPRRRSSGVRKEDIPKKPAGPPSGQARRLLDAIKANLKLPPQQKIVPDPQKNPAQEPTAQPAAPVAPAVAIPAAAAGAQPRKPSPKERIQAALEATAGEPSPALIIPRLPPPKAGPTNAVAGKVRAFVVPPDSTAASSSTAAASPAAAAAAVAGSTARVSSSPRAGRSGPGSIPPDNKRLVTLGGAGTRLLTGPRTKSGAIKGTPLQPIPLQKQVKFKSPARLPASSVVPFLGPRDLARYQGNKQQLIANLLNRPGVAQGQRRVGGMYRPPQQAQQNQPLQENRPPQQNWSQQRQQQQQQAQQAQQPQLQLPKAFMFANSLRGGSALTPAKPPGPPTPLVRRINPANRKVGGQYAIGARRQHNILRGPGPSRLQHAWTPADVAEGGKAGRAKSGLFAGLKVRRGTAVAGQTSSSETPGAPEAIQEGAGGSGQPTEQQEPVSSIGQGIARNGRLLVAYEPREPSPPPSPREIERRRLELERFHARNLLHGGSLLGIDPVGKESTDDDEEGHADEVREEGDSQDPMVMSDQPSASTISRFGNFFKSFGGFGS
ncbi:unnamed protein product [Sordaria macrospora k-hell]|uniref:WGS project CABT00000000 data, contig 2.4 n=1 Tax=Sordaria macrospora (strain ATCC MYA-333 / DSM 997 / K(L3346) / K-hell) TaxID=771870 RepID=F7VQU9_SORMK|nr:uncharacterized protein SMAC_01446 [Sordaria macrospora k-hell]CCC07881.1 unnamed protein product [Sordaria macrospora k-hell]